MLPPRSFQGIQPGPARPYSGCARPEGSGAEQRR